MGAYASRYLATFHAFDFTNCQMLFVYIEKCRMFEDQLVPLHPKYNVVRSGEKFIVELNSEYVAITEEFRLNVLALCGRNGVGKSTFLRMLSGRHVSDSEITICWRDSKGEIAVNRKADIIFLGNSVALTAEIHNISLHSLCGNGNLGEENSIQRSFLEPYTARPEVFQLHGQPVFDGFHLDLNPQYSEFHDLENHLSEHLGMEKPTGELADIARYHPLFHLLADLAQDSTFRGIVAKHAPNRKISFWKIYQALRDKESNLIEAAINRLLYANGKRGGQYDTDENGTLTPKDPDWRLFEMEQYVDVKKSLIRISKRIDKWISQKLKPLQEFVKTTEGINLHLEKYLLPKLLAFRPYKIHDGELFRLEDLSSGERYQIKLLFELAPKIMSGHACWFYEDDLDEFFHPEWKRTLVERVLNTYLEFTDRIADSSGNSMYRDRISTFVIATHSPFVLSDLPKECVLRFEKIGNGKTKISRASENTFAGNIGELFHAEFFMTATIGEFARKRIKAMIQVLEKSPDPPVLDAATKLFSLVGDDVLRNLLFEKLRHAENKAHKNTD